MTTMADVRTRPLPPLLGKQSIADLLGVLPEMLDDVKGLPRPDEVVGVWRFWHPQTILDWAAGNGLVADHDLELLITTTTAQMRTRPLPPLLGKQSIAQLLGVSPATVDDWRAKTVAAVRARKDPDLPVPDRISDNRPLWHPQTIVDWAVSQGSLPADHGLDLPAREVVLWSQTDIKNFFGVSLGTVRERWRFFYVHAITHGLPVPTNALPPEDFDVDGTPFWLPKTILAWGRKTGKLGTDDKPLKRNGFKWVAEPVAKVTVVDPADELIAAGQLWDWTAMAAFFGVKEKTVKTWTGPHSAGKDFPAPDGGRKLNGKPLWKPRTVMDWAKQERRLDENDRPTPVRGGRRPGAPRRAAAQADAEALVSAA